MKRTKSLAVVTGFAMVTLAACGGDGGSGGGSGSTSEDKFIDSASSFELVEAEGPAPEVEGATTGGTITVLIPSDPGPEDLDPTNGWSVLGNSIQQDLVNRSLTQYRRTAEGGTEVVPDLATDLGTPNEDFTEWTFTIKDDARWETGDPVTAEEVKNGILRSFDTDTFTSGPGQAYTVGWVDCPEDYAGPTKSGDCDAVQADGQELTIRMSQPFPEFNLWSTFMAIGPIPLENSEFPAYGRKPLATGPYKIQDFRVNESLTLVKNDQWDPATDPSRHQYADEFVIKFDQDQEKTDQILLSGNADSATTVANSLGATNANALKEALGSNYIQQTGQCISTRTPDYNKIPQLEIRQ
ncbi:ABC transporter substrate-binding protein, partial [uncultured Nocardioides sp.]|uniref:ABC transporter substrate-binding protein n=1 Tax=uncultured Nocardioides sp. TaxID=198441 RepID=UPI0025DBB365